MGNQPSGAYRRLPPTPQHPFPGARRCVKPDGHRTATGDAGDAPLRRQVAVMRKDTRGHHRTRHIATRWRPQRPGRWWLRAGQAKQRRCIHIERYRCRTRNRCEVIRPRRSGTHARVRQTAQGKTGASLRTRPDSSAHKNRLPSHHSTVAPSHLPHTPSRNRGNGTPSCRFSQGCQRRFFAADIVNRS